MSSRRSQPEVRLPYQADAEERIRSAHRAIEIREKRRGVLSSFCLDYLALQPTSSVNDAPVTVHAIA